MLLFSCLLLSRGGGRQGGDDTLVDRSGIAPANVVREVEHDLVQLLGSQFAVGQGTLYLNLDQVGPAKSGGGTEDQ